MDKITSCSNNYNGYEVGFFCKDIPFIYEHMKQNANVMEALDEDLLVLRYEESPYNDTDIYLSIGLRDKGSFVGYCDFEKTLLLPDCEAEDISVDDMKDVLLEDAYNFISSDFAAKDVLVIIHSILDLHNFMTKVMESRK